MTTSAAAQMAQIRTKSTIEVETPSTVLNRASGGSAGAGGDGGGAGR